jgi:hypothetical protein
LLQALRKSRQACVSFRIVRCKRSEHADATHTLGLLRARRDRPRDRRAADKRLKIVLEEGGWTLAPGVSRGSRPASRLARESGNRSALSKICPYSGASAIENDSPSAMAEALVTDRPSPSECRP